MAKHKHIYDPKSQTRLMEPHITNARSKTNKRNDLDQRSSCNTATHEHRKKLNFTAKVTTRKKPCFYGCIETFLQWHINLQGGHAAKKHESQEHDSTYEAISMKKHSVCLRNISSNTSPAEVLLPDANGCNCSRWTG
jgi:hypothetical protein